MYRVVCFVVLVGACSRSHAGPDDAGTDAGGASESSELPAVRVGEHVDPDDHERIDEASARPAAYGCLGTTARPTPGSVVPVVLELELLLALGYGSDFAGSVCVSVFDDDVVRPDEGCTGDWTWAGSLDLDLRSESWFSYRVHAKDGPTPSTVVRDTVHRHVRVPAAGGDIAGRVLTDGRRNALPSIVGYRPADRSALVWGDVRDCDGAPVYGTRVRIARADGTYVLEGSEEEEPRHVYFDGDGFPAFRQPWTHRDGQFLAANLRVEGSAERVYVEAWGRTEAWAPLRLLGCETTWLYPDGLAVVQLGPVRSGGPHCPGLAE